MTTQTQTDAPSDEVHDDDESCCMSLVVEQKDEWILEQLLKEASSPVVVPPPHQGAASSSCYWMILERDTGRLLASKDEIPENSNADQVFRLSLLLSSTSTTTRTTTADASQSPSSRHQVEGNSTDGVSTNVGTKVLFSDEYVRIWEFRIGPQERCPYHRHHCPYVYFNLTESLTQELNREGTVVEEEPRLQLQGQSTFIRKDKLGEHAVRNVGNGVFLQFIVEFLV